MLMTKIRLINTLIRKQFTSSNVSSKLGKNNL